MTEFTCPTRICAGPDALSILKTLQAERVLVITDRFFSQNGTADRIGAMVPGAEVKIFDRVTPDPEASLAAEAGAVCREFRPQLLLALGGGSPMDCAKAVRLTAEAPLLFVAVPTTSGSGSEVTSFSILTKDGMKHPLVDPCLRPELAILDDSLLQQLPPGLIAQTGMDQLAHCVEAVAATGSGPFTDCLAMEGARIVLRHLKDSHRGDTTVRGLLHQSAAMAGVAFDNAGLGLCHGLAHAIGGRWHLPHGMLCAMVLPHVIRWNRPAAGKQYQKLASYCGLAASMEEAAVRSLSGAVSRLRAALGLPETLTAAGIGREDLRAGRKAVAEAAAADGCCRTNPVPVTVQMAEDVLKAVEG